MNFRQIEAFRAVMRLNSVTAAARALNVSQPSISRFLSELETSVGFALFQRQRGRIVPTAEGATLAAEIDRCYVGLDELQKSVERIRSGTAGQLLIGSVPALTFEILPAAIGRFRRQFPDISISCQNRDSDKLIDWTAAHRLNLALVADRVQTSGVETIRHFSAPCVAVVPDRHPLSTAKALSFDDLKAYPFISLGLDFFQKHSNGRRLIRGLGGPAKIETFASYSACAMLAGIDGVTIVDPFTAMFFCRHFPLVSCRLAEPIPYEFSLIKRATDQQSSYAVGFIKTLIATINASLAAAPKRRKAPARS